MQKDKYLWMIFLVVFLLGWTANVVYSNIDSDFILPAKELPSPGDHIKDYEIAVYDGMVVLHIKNAHWAEFTDTNSMDPVLDIGANSIEKKPLYPTDIEPGDIISYQSSLVDSLIIHRVVEIDYDKQGWFARAKGDNNLFMDVEKIRFDQVKGIVVAVIY